MYNTYRHKINVNAFVWSWIKVKILKETGKRGLCLLLDILCDLSHSMVQPIFVRGQTTEI